MKHTRGSRINMSTTPAVDNLGHCYWLTLTDNLTGNVHVNLLLKSRQLFNHCKSVVFVMIKCINRGNIHITKIIIYLNILYKRIPCLKLHVSLRLLP